MVEQEIHMLVTQLREDTLDMNRVEVIEASRALESPLYPVLSSFANRRGGGIILFGLQGPKCSASGIYDVDDLQQLVLLQGRQMSPEVHPLCTRTRIDRHDVLCVEIPECPFDKNPCHYLGAGRVHGSYIRLNTDIEPMTEYEIYRYEEASCSLQEDLTAVMRAGFESFHPNVLNQYLRSIRTARPNLQHMLDQEILTMQGLLQDGRPTIGGIMMFGIYPQAYFPHLFISALIYDTGCEGSEICTLIDRKKIEGTIPQMLSDSINLIRTCTRMLADRTVRETTAGPEDDYPSLAIRELLLNALVHRDYSIHTIHRPIEIHIYSDHLIIESPGGMFGRMDIEDLGKRDQRIRNPHLAGAVEVLMHSSNSFCGIPSSRKALKAAGLPEPVFQDIRGRFLVSLYAARMGKEGRSISQTEERLFQYCRTPRSRDEIAREFGYTKAYVISEYINPLVQAGLLQLTLPEVPKSKRQQYVTRAGVPG
jgi:ATP-dependent DNA helicase RecG